MTDDSYHMPVWIGISIRISISKIFNSLATWYQKYQKKVVPVRKADGIRLAVAVKIIF